MAVRPSVSLRGRPRMEPEWGSSAAVTARSVHRDGEGELVRFQLDTPVNGSAKVLICA